MMRRIDVVPCAGGKKEKKEHRAFFLDAGGGEGGKATPISPSLDERGRKEKEREDKASYLR